MIPLEELRLLARVATLYYKVGMKQSDIAERLDLSQATISRILTRALNDGVVQISFSTPPHIFADLENELCVRYDLKSAIVVDGDHNISEHLIHQRLGSAAAFYLETTLGKDEVIGVSSWNAALRALLDGIRPIKRRFDARVVQMIGAVGSPTAVAQASRLTERMAYFLKGTAVYLPVPSLAQSKSARDQFLHDPSVEQTVAMYDQLTLAVTGIGSFDPANLLLDSGGEFSLDELDFFRQTDIVGDICLRFFNARGEFIRSPLDDRLISISPAQIQRVRRAIGIAFGQRRVPAIRAAILGKWINILITDRHTAEMLLRGD